MINPSVDNINENELNLKKISGGDTPIKNKLDTVDLNESNIVNQMPQTPEGSPPNFQPHTPEDSPPNLQAHTPEGPPPNLQARTPEGPPPNFKPGTPEGPPPGLITQSVPDQTILIEENNENDKKQQQLDLLKQTYVDITKRKMNRQKNIFNPIIDNIKIVLPINKIDKNLNVKMKTYLKEKLELKCNKHGLIKKDSVIILNISAGGVSGCIADFMVTYQALACNPVEGMIVEATILNITKAGIRAELVNYSESPMIIFISRDHHHDNEYFKSLKEKSMINVKIIGVRYELNDKFVSVIGELYKI